MQLLWFARASGILLPQKGGFRSNGSTQNRWFVMENPIKMDDLWVPPSWFSHGGSHGSCVGLWFGDFSWLGPFLTDALLSWMQAENACQNACALRKLSYDIRCFSSSFFVSLGFSSFRASPDATCFLLSLCIDTSPGFSKKSNSSQNWQQINYAWRNVHRYQGHLLDMVLSIVTKYFITEQPIILTGLTGFHISD